MPARDIALELRVDAVSTVVLLHRSGAGMSVPARRASHIDPMIALQDE